MRRGPRVAVIPNIDDATCWRTHIYTSAKLLPPERDDGREGSRDAPSSRATTLAPACDSQRGSLLLWITGAVCGGEETVRNVVEDFAQSNERRRQQEERRRAVYGHTEQRCRPQYDLVHEDRTAISKRFCNILGQAGFKTQHQRRETKEERRSLCACAETRCMGGAFVRLCGGDNSEVQRGVDKTSHF